MYTIELVGGLGNWMFQIALSEYLKSNFNVEVYLCSYGKPGLWSTTDLFSNIFKEWKNLERGRTCDLNAEEQNVQPIDWNQLISTYKDLHIIGYFQNYNYITPSFLSKLSLPSESLNRYNNIENTVFLHIRGGDYINCGLLDLKLDNYYHRAIKEFPADTKFSVFTNDIPYANTKNFLNNISYEIIQESEVDSMFLMSKCKGGICANSTFSWWGAFLNRNRKLILPSKWWNNPKLYSEGIYFPEATIIPV
jgi:hypothetical protein